MERICKNCDQLLYAHKTYCSSCGAKWIEKRITMRNVAGDFADLYLGFDTRFVRTFIDLFKKPEAVINGYITGRRMAYIDAVRYLLLSVFVSGMTLLAMRFMDLDMGEIANAVGSNQLVGKSEEERKMFKGMMDGMMDFMTNYQAFILFGTIPFLALIGRITFWGKRFYNFTEQAVFQMYAYSHVMIIATPISTMCMLVNFQLSVYMSLLTYISLIVYNAYAYKRCFKLNLQEIILRSLVAIFVIIILIILIMILGALGGFIYAKLIR